MIRNRGIYPILLIVLIASVCLIGCGREENKIGGRMEVAASIGPLYDFTRQVGGDLVEVSLLVPPGASPHTYQLTPDQMKLLSRASVLVLNGMNLEFWADKAVDAADNPKLIVVRTAEGLKTIDSAGDRDHAHGNPHVWLSPICAIHQVEAIRDALSRADRIHADVYKANARAYIEKLRRLDADIRARVGAFKTKGFVAFHPAWVYFARDYGLEQAAVIERSPGREPSPSEVADIVKVARSLKAKAIFAEPQFSPKAAEVIAEEADAKVLMLDPLGKPPNYDYIRTMRGNLDQMAKALE